MFCRKVRARPCAPSTGCLFISPPPNPPPSRGRVPGRAAHSRGAVETGGDRVERDVGPPLRVHELLPAPIEEALVVLRDVALGDEPRIIRMRPRMPQAHRQILRVPAPEAARARGGYLAPVV